MFFMFNRQHKQHKKLNNGTFFCIQAAGKIKKGLLQKRQSRWRRSFVFCFARTKCALFTILTFRWLLHPTPRPQKSLPNKPAIVKTCSRQQHPRNQYGNTQQANFQVLLFSSSYYLILLHLLWRPLFWSVLMSSLTKESPLSNILQYIIKVLSI